MLKQCRDGYCAAQNGDFIMSLHKSLKGSTKIRVRRNVLKRFERIDKLQKEDKWKAGDKVLGLQKTKPE